MTHIFLPIEADDVMMAAGAAAGAKALLTPQGTVGHTVTRAIWDAMVAAKSEHLAQLITTQVLFTLKEGGDNLAILNAVRKSLGVQS